MPLLSETVTDRATPRPRVRPAHRSAGGPNRAQGSRPTAITRTGLLGLQRSAGNAAVAAMMSGRQQSAVDSATPVEEQPAPTESVELDRAAGEQDRAETIRPKPDPRSRATAQRAAGLVAVPRIAGHRARLDAGPTRRSCALQRHSLTGVGPAPAAAGRVAADNLLLGKQERGPPSHQPAPARRHHDHFSQADHSARGAPVRPDAPAEHTRDHRLPAPRDDLGGQLDLLTGAALLGAPVLSAAREVGHSVSVQRISLNPVEWAKKVWNKVKDLGGAALEKAKSLGGGALDKARALGSQVTSAVGGAVTAAWSAIADAARSGMSRLGAAATSALQTLGGLARQGLSAAGKVARSALDGALRLGRAAWDKAASVGRKALDVAMRAGRAVVDTGKSLASKAWAGVKSKVGGLWNGLKAKAAALKNKVLAGAKGLLAKATALGGKAVDAAKGLVDKVGGAICSMIGRATAWVYGKVAPLAKKAWEWVKENPAKTIAMLLIPGGPLIALGLVLQKKMLDLAKQLFAPVVAKILAKAKAAWNTAKQWGAKALGTAKQWAGKALSGAAALGKKALGAATDFGRKVLGKAKDLGARVIGKAREWGQQTLGKARDLGQKVWGKAQQLGGKLLGLADRLTGGLASKVKGLADRILGKASGVLSWVLDRAKGLADKALSAAKSLATKVLSKAKDLASKAWDKAKDLGRRAAAKAKDFAAQALAKGKDLIAKAGRAAVDFGKQALQGAKNLAAKAVATAKEWGAKAWSTAKQWGAKAWAKAKDLGGKAWDWTKKQAGKAWDWAKGIGAKLAPYAQQAWDWAKRIGKALGIDKVIAVVKSLKDKAFDLAKKGFALIKDKVLPLVEKLRQVRNTVMSYTAVGALCKAVGCAYKGFIPRKGGEDVEGALDLATDVIPVVSTVKDTCTCLVGENFVTNKKAGMAEQGIACAFAAIDIAGYAGAAFSGGGSAAAAIGLRAAVKGGIKVGGKVIAKEALEAAIKKGGRELAEKLGKEGLQELAEKLGKEGLQELAEKMGKEEFEKLVKEAAEKGVKGFDGVIEKGAKEGAEAAGEKGVKEGAEGAGEKGAKEGAEGAGEKGAKEGAEGAGEKGAKEGADGSSLKETPSGVAVCVQALAVQRLMLQRVIIQRIVVQRAKAKAGDVCALLPKGTPKRSTDAIKELIDSGGKLPPSLVKNPELLAKIAKDPNAMEGLCTLLQRTEALGAKTQKALIDALAKHGDNLLPMLHDVKKGINRLDPAEFGRLVNALAELPTNLPGLTRWVDQLNGPYKKLRGTLGEIEYAAKLQDELVGSGRRIAQVADTVGGKEAGDILVVVKRGKSGVEHLDEIIDVKNYNWAHEYFSRTKNLQRKADEFAKQGASLAQRYAAAYGLPVNQVEKMVVFVLRGSPPKEFLDMLTVRCGWDEDDMDTVGR